jgi:arsenate reductase-like glutaredoxin family protein
MTNNLELFSTKECSKCSKLGDYLTKMGIQYTKRMIDADPEAETDALMLNIIAAPALKKGGVVLRTKDLFMKDQIIEDKVRSFVSN